MKHFALLTALFFFPVSAAFAEYLHGSQGMVSSRSDLASEVGSQILEQGGNAVDASVAVGFSLAVTYPSAGNLGGGGFMMIQRANGEVHALDFREKAPGNAHRHMFLDANGDVDRDLALNSLQSSGVPGSVAGLLDALEAYGTQTRQTVLAPAIRLAQEGFILDEDLAGQLRDNMNDFSKHPASLAKFTNNGAAYLAGERWIQADLADTLKRIAEHGRDGFYKGRTADLITAEMQKNNGLITHEDLENYTTVWREPVQGTYRGYDIWSMPAPSSGGILLVHMLNMLELFDLKNFGWSSPQIVHLMIEAERRAYADRAKYLGDPDYVEVPTQMLTSKAYALGRFNDLDMQRAGDSNAVNAGSWPDESPDTTHYSVLDEQGNAVSVTITLNLPYGNKIVVPGTGILLNNEMDDFSSKPGAPNAYGLIGSTANEIQAGKRMLSSMTPTIVSKHQKPVLITGSPGGSTIITTVLQVIVNVIDHGMAIGDAVARPRFHHQWKPDEVRYESGAIADETATMLRAMGHKGLVESRSSIGDANSIMVIDGAIEGISDPRHAGGVAGF